MVKLTQCDKGGHDEDMHNDVVYSKSTVHGTCLILLRSVQVAGLDAGPRQQ